MNLRQIKRLQKLAHFLIDEVPRHSFDMDIILNEVCSKDIDTLNNLRQSLKSEKSCGTAGCAMGWMPVVFPRSIKIFGASIETSNGECYNFGAANLFFGLTSNESCYLFTARKGNRRPDSVGRNLLKFCDKKIKEKNGLGC